MNGPMKGIVMINFEIRQNAMLSGFYLLQLDIDGRSYYIASSNRDRILFLIQNNLLDSLSLIESAKNPLDELNYLLKDIYTVILDDIIKKNQREIHFVIFDEFIPIEEFYDNPEERVLELLMREESFLGPELLFFKIVPMLTKFYLLSDKIDMIDILSNDEIFDETMEEYSKYEDDDILKEQVIHRANEIFKEISAKEYEYLNKDMLA